MTAYQGITDTDSIVGGGAHVDTYKHGGEVCNFAVHNGCVFGYVQAPKGRRKKNAWRDIKLERLGAKKSDDWIDGIKIIWTARRPGVGRVVIGWYNQATLFRRYQYFDNPPELQRLNGLDGYVVRARASDVKLLLPDQRVVAVPSKKKGTFGQSNIWYADTRKAKKVAAKVIRDVKRTVRASAKKKPTRARRRGILINQAMKRAVEKAAITQVWKYYESLGYTVSTVEKDNLGWDLSACLGDVTLRIEVKGLSAADGSIELTPNEYKAFKRKDADYRLCIVTAALKSRRRRLRVFSYHRLTSRWLDELSNALNLQIRTRTGATVQMNRIAG